MWMMSSLSGTLQLKLDAIQSWATQNDAKLNGKKCKGMIISFLQWTDYLIDKNF